MGVEITSGKKSMLVKTYDAIVKEYVEHEKQSTWRNTHIDKFLGMLKHRSSILDVGCGPGQDAKAFSDAGHDVTGIDLSEKMIANAMKRAPKAKFLRMDVEKLDFEMKFDAMWAAFVLVHLERNKIPPVIRKFHELLKPNGILFLGMLEGSGEVVIPEPYNKKYKQYFLFCSKKEVEKWLNDAGFDMLSHSTEEIDEEGEVFNQSFIYARKK